MMIMVMMMMMVAVVVVLAVVVMVVVMMMMVNAEDGVADEAAEQARCSWAVAFSWSRADSDDASAHHLGPRLKHTHPFCWAPRGLMLNKNSIK